MSSNVNGNLTTSKTFGPNRVPQTPSTSVSKGVLGNGTTKGPEQPGSSTSTGAPKDAPQAPTSNEPAKAKETVNGAPKVTAPNASTTAPVDDPEQKKFDAAVARYDELVKRLGNPQAAKDFIATFGLGPIASEDKASPHNDSKTYAKDLLASRNVDTSFVDRTPTGFGASARPEGYGAKYLEEGWAIDQISGVDNPASLTPEAWRVVCQSSGLLQGFRIIASKSLVTTPRARLPAFEIKDNEINDGYNIGGRIPAYEVYDNSSIIIKESSAAEEVAMAESGFSSTAISVAISGGFAGWSAALDVGKNSQTQTSSSASSGSTSKSYTATYNFPRTRVYLDEFNLTLTAQCKKRLLEIRQAVQKIKDNVAEKQSADENYAVSDAMKLVNQFKIDFGVAFATSAQLGGQLWATRSADSYYAGSSSQHKDAMRLSVAASFGSPWVDASASYQGETQTDQAKSRLSNTSSSALAWSARGGNTLLLANPPQWADSLASFSTWRAMERDGLVLMTDLISKLTEGNERPWRDIHDLFLQVHHACYALQGPRWNSKFTLESSDGSQELIDESGWLKLVSKDDSRPALVMTALDADISASHIPYPKLEAPYAEYPMFITTDAMTARDPKRGSQIPGIFANEKGLLGTEQHVSSPITRWSFRSVKDTPPNFKDSWKPKARILKNGEEVRLYCHSHASGSYRDINKPPYWAPQIYVEKTTPSSLRVATVPSNIWRQVYDANKELHRELFTKTDDEIQAMMSRYDCMTCTDSEKKMLEKIGDVFGFRDATIEAKLKPNQANQWQGPDQFEGYVLWRIQRWQDGRTLVGTEEKLTPNTNTDEVILCIKFVE